MTLAIEKVMVAANILLLATVAACGGDFVRPDGARADASLDGDGGHGSDAGVADGVLVYEAERAFFAGAAHVANAPSGFTGDGFVDGLAAPADRLVFTVNGASAGADEAVLAYRNPGAQPTDLAIDVNGAPSGTITLAPSGTDAFATATATLTLRAGLDTITFRPTNGAAAIAIDHLAVAHMASLAARGATVPFVAYEAEDATLQGETIGPDRTYHTVASEASGRRAVRLSAPGDHVEFTLTRPANALVLRFSIPDAPGGGGTTAALDLTVDGAAPASVPLSSKYAWVYGGYPYQNDPSQGLPHRFFDDAIVHLGAEVPVGAKVRLALPANASAPVVIDRADFESAPAPYERPAGSLSIADFGASADGGGDDTQAIRDALAAGRAQGKVVWIPTGEFSLTTRVDVEGVTLRGAGPWSSVLRGKDEAGGLNAVGDAPIQLVDFAFFGDVTHRNDGAPNAGVDGRLPAGSLVQNVWFEHTKVGLWDIGGASTLVVGCRIHDTYADGINLNGGTRGVVVEHVHVRNTGDDGLAMWSNGPADQDDTFRFATVELPMLANGIALYGGQDLRVEDSQVTDTIIASAGLAISTRAEFGPLPFAGTTVAARNSLVRTGGYEENWHTAFSGLWVFADASAITSAVVVSDTEILDSNFQGLLLSGGKSIENVRFERVRIDGATSLGIEVSTSGQGDFTDVSVAGAGQAATSIAPGFQVVRQGSHTGW